ncbi:hypothetical protein IM40_02680 [Candidatus Paracaedimonas acanthamoebae]|nr:hypothetical protein IM40_02680 [Candidatus Paracaedimonas acanthamoebae]
MLNYFFSRFIQVGTLTVIDDKGNPFIYSKTPTPAIVMRLHSKKIARHLCLNPELALGEGYMNGEITVENGSIYDLLYLLVLNLQECSFSCFQSLRNKIAYFFRAFHQHNPISKAKSNVAHHYDLNKEFYAHFLDPDLQYSCAYFHHLGESLESAQKHKKEHLAAKLKLQPGQKILDIGSGWGGLGIHLAKEADVDVTGLTLSQEQLAVANERAEKAGLSHRVRFHLRDYRQEQGIYDRIVSVGMFEHVGVKYYPQFFKQVYSLLAKDGIAVLHSIGCSTGPSTTGPWIQKYIFPGGYCPALSETLSALEPSKLLVTDIELLHHHYAETLHQWRKNFLHHYKKIELMLGEKFCRMWEFYLAGCEITFRLRGYMVFQIQMVKDLQVAPLNRQYLYHGLPLTQTQQAI